MNIRALFKGTVILTLMSAVTVLGNMLLLPLFSRVMTPEQFGIVGVVAPFISIVAVIFNFGFTIAASRHIVEYPRETGELGSYLYTITVTLFVASLVGLFFLLLPPTGHLTAQLFGLDNIRFRYIVLAYLQGILTTFLLLVNVYYNYVQKYSRRVLITLVGFVINNGLSLLVIFLYKDGALGELLGVVVAQAIMVAFLANEFLREFKPKFQTKYIRACLQIGIPVTITGLFSTIANSGNRFIMNLFLPLDVIGQYTIAWTLTSAISIVFTSFNVTWMPIFFKDMQQNKSRREVEPYLIAMIVVITTFVLLGQLFIKDVVLILLSKRYYDAIEMSVGLFPYFLGTAISTFLVNYFVHFKTTHLSAFAYIVAGIFGLVANYLLIPLMGIDASVALMTVSQVILCFLMFVILYVKYQLRFQYWVYLILLLIVSNPIALQISKQASDSIQNLSMKILYFALMLGIMFWLLPMKREWLAKSKRFLGTLKLSQKTREQTR